MIDHSSKQLRAISRLLLVAAVSFCLFGAVGSAYEIFNSEMAQRSFKLSPWIIFHWSIANLFWIFFGSVRQLFFNSLIIILPVGVIIVDLATAIIVSIEQSAFSFLPLLILSVFFFALGASRLEHEKSS